MQKNNQAQEIRLKENAGIIFRIKRNRFIRGFYMFYKTFFTCSRKKFGHISDSVRIIGPTFLDRAENIYLYENTTIAANSYISAFNANFTIKKNCAIAEGLTVHTGNHARVLGKFITQITEDNKPGGYDKEIIVNEDCWIGCNVTLLSGVTIGRGCTIAAGAVVNKDIPPYCIAGGVPAKVIKRIWTIDEIIQHEEALYPEEERFTREQLIEIYKPYGF